MVTLAYNVVKIIVTTKITHPRQATSGGQRCHFKKIKTRRRATEKIPESPRANFYTIGLHFGKKSNFSWKKSNFSWKKSNFSWKKSNFSAKIKVSEDLFFFF